MSAVIPIHRQDPSHPQAQVCRACEVRRSSLFGALDDASLDRIHAHIDSFELGADATVYPLGERGSAVYTVRAGMVRFERVTQRGDRRIVRLAGRGDLIGQEALLQRPYADAAIACTPVQLCRIPRALIDTLGDNQAALLRELMLRWQDALDAAESWVAELSTGPARRRVLRLLVRLADQTDARGQIWLPRREEIGAMLDMTFETASRMLSQLRRAGVIEVTSQRTARLDVAALRQAVLAEDAG